MCVCTNINLFKEDHFDTLPFPKQMLPLLFYLLGDCVLSALSFFSLPSRSKILDPFLLGVSAFLFHALPLSFPFLSPQTERDRVARDPTEQTGVPAWNARLHTDAATPTCGSGSPLRGLPVVSFGFPSARASATPRAHRR